VCYLCGVAERQRATYVVQVAGFFLFHPEDFPEADESQDWIDVPDDALEQGLVVGLRLGAGGPRAVEVCLGALPDGERDQVEEPWVFRLEVKHGALFAGDHIEGPGALDWASEPSVKVPNGKYRAEWSYLTAAARQKRNANWVVALAPVADFSGIGVWPELPHEDDPPGRPPLPPAAVPPRRVHHAKFGEGTVLAEDPGPPPRLTIQFADGERKLLASFVRSAS